MSAENTKKIVFVVLGVCFVCSLLVSIFTVTLRDKQEQNKKIDMLQNILIAGDLYHKGIDIQKTFEKKIKPIIVDLTNSKILPDEQYTEKVNIENFNIKEWAEDPEISITIPKEKDIAKIRKIPKYMVVYQVISDNGKVDRYIFPIYGKGLWSTLYGFIALSKDLRTIQGFTFYEHGETPGLGGEVDNPRWKAIWKGKQAYDENWNVKITVIKGKVDPSNPNAKYQVDGLSGATLTTRGVDNLVKFWLGENGYGRFIKQLKEGEVS